MSLIEPSVDARPHLLLEEAADKMGHPPNVYLDFPRRPSQPISSSIQDPVSSIKKLVS